MSVSEPRASSTPAQTRVLITVHLKIQLTPLALVTLVLEMRRVYLGRFRDCCARLEILFTATLNTQ
jgi:hypothetical protein